MAPRGRDGAVAMLKDTFMRRFGPSLQDAIDAEVEGQLVGRDRLDKEDIDAIERRLLAAKRQQRGGGNTRRAHARSAPNLLGAVTAGGTQVPSVPSTAPPPPITSPPAPSGPSSRQPSAGLRLTQGALERAPTLARHLKCPSAADIKLPEPPYGVAVSDDRDDASERSHVVVVPKRPVPKRPKLKPMDHWDLLVSFDAQKNTQDQKTWQSQGKGASKVRFKAVLDEQMMEIRGLKEQEAAAKFQEREDMSRTIENNKKLTQMEEDILQAKRDKMKKANDEMTASLQQRRLKAREKKQREQEQMLNWLESERERKEQEEHEARVGYARKCKKAREELEIAREDAARRRKAEQDLDKAVAAAQVKAMDEAEANNKAAVKARMDQIERNCETIGAEIAGRDARMERELAEKIKKVQEEADRASKEDAERRQREHKQRTDAMLTKLAEQVREREAAGLEEKKASIRQAEVWREQYEEGLRSDKEKEEKRRRDREKLDAELIDQIRESMSIHPRNFAMTSTTQRMDIAYNKALFEHMSQQGFRGDVMDQLLGQAKDRGKIDPFPSVGRYEGPIHDMELQVPEG